MKLKRLLLLPFFLVTSSYAVYQQQWFSQFQESDDGIQFVCEWQCVALIAPLAGSDYVDLQGTVQGSGIVGYGFLVGQQIAPAQTLPVWWTTSIDQRFTFNELPFYSQIPQDAQLVIVVEGTLSATMFSASLWSLWISQKIWNGFKQALEYKEYNPRTINFLEWPMWNGKYINQVFFRWIIWFLLLAFLRYFFANDTKQKKKAVYLWIGVLAFFWIFFDFFSTVNQIKIYNQTMSATTLMENGRVGRTSDFYQFLDFIKTKFPTWIQGAFIAPYPFEFEWKYHIYPDVKFNALTWVQYIFVYNPYGSQAPFDFVDPMYSGGILTWKDLMFSVQEEIVRRPYAKIYILKK